MRKIKKVLLLSAVMALLLLSACQPTPQADIVVGKSEGFFETGNMTQTKDQARSTKDIVFSNIDAPSRVESEAVMHTNISIAQNAEVVVPDAQAYPITEVSKRVFTDSDIMSMIKQLAGDTPLYLNYIPSKEDFLKDITIAKQNIGTDGITQEYIDGLQEQFNMAPEQSEKMPFDIEKCPSEEYISIWANKENGDVSSFVFKKRDNVFEYSRNIKQFTMPKSSAERNITIESKWNNPKTPSISESEAQKIAQELMKNIGVDLNLRSSEPSSIIQNAMQLHAGWQFVFTRNIAGLQPDYNYYPIAHSQTALPSTGAPWGQEVFIIVIDEEGVCALRWDGASNISKMLSNSEELEDFEIIQERVVNQINFIFGTDNLQSVKREYTITKYELGLAMVSVQDNFDLGWYIPAWYVTYEHTGKEGVSVQQIIFNAIDGSYIEPRVTTKMLMG